MESTKKPSTVIQHYFPADGQKNSTLWRNKSIKQVLRDVGSLVNTVKTLNKNHDYFLLDIDHFNYKLMRARWVNKNTSILDWISKKYNMAVDFSHSGNPLYFYAHLQNCKVKKAGRIENILIHSSVTVLIVEEI